MEGITETCFSVKDPQSSGMNGKYFFLDCLALMMKALVLLKSRNHSNINAM